MDLYCSPRLSEVLGVYADCADGTEISLLGRLEVIDRTPYLTEVRLIPQTGSPAKTHIKMRDLSDFVVTLGDDAPNWRCWIHTHPGRGLPSYSPEDTDTLELLARLPGYFVGVVLNEEGESSKVYLAMSNPFEVLTETGKLRATSSLTEEERDLILQDVVENVRPPEKENVTKKGEGGVGHPPAHGGKTRTLWDAAAKLGPPKNAPINSFLYQVRPGVLIWAIWNDKDRKVVKVSDVDMEAAVALVPSELIVDLDNDKDDPDAATLDTDVLEYAQMVADQGFIDMDDDYEGW
jgi:hypothetical protein